MKFEEEEEIEFKSFNTGYMIWLLSHAGAIELYSSFYEDLKDDIIKTFKSKYSIKSKTEIAHLNNYIKNLALTFSDEEKKNVDSVDDDKLKANDIQSVKTTCSSNDGKINSVGHTSNVISKNIDIFSSNVFDNERKNEWNIIHENKYEKMFRYSFNYDRDYIFHQE